MRDRAEVKQRAIRIESWLAGPADRFGECDDCHCATVALWDDVDTEGAGDFSHCRGCWSGRLDGIRRGLRNEA